MPTCGRSLDRLIGKVGEAFVKQKLNWGSRRRLGSLLFAVAMGLIGLVQGAQTAHADAVNPIVPGSMKLRNKSSEATIYVWHNVEVSGEWRIPDQSGREGDTFTIGLPEIFSGVNGSFDLAGSGGAPVYGTCTVSKSEVSCVLNGNVVGKNDVGGDFYINTQVSSTYKGSTVGLTVNGGNRIEVPLPNGQTDIGYSPEVPQNIEKIGYPTGNPYDSIHWKVRIPGQELEGGTLTLDDVFTVPGSTLTVKPGEVILYRIPNNDPVCWNENWSAACQSVLYRNDGGSYPDVTATIDASNRIQLTYNKAGGFSKDDMYLFEYSLSAGEEILVGAQYPNTITINGRSYEGVTTRESSGGGSGSGDTVGHLSIQKTVSNNAGNTVPADTVFPVEYSYAVNGRAKTGTLSLRADGTRESLYNIPHGTVVTFSEKVPTVSGVDFGDPVFSGEGVTDAAPDAESAQVTVVGSRTLAVTLTNSINPKLVSVGVSPGVCVQGAAEPSDPIVTVGSTDGITYSTPELTRDGDQVTVKVTATPAAGRQIDDQDVPGGWVANGDGSFTFTGTVMQPACPRDVVPVVPTIDVGVCPADSLTPSVPTATFDAVEGVEFSEPVIEVVGGKVTVTATASAKDGFRFGDQLPEGWTRTSETSATFTTTRDQPVCEATKVVPVAPTVSASVCTVGSTTPSEPEVTPPVTEGIVYAVTNRRIAGGKFTYTVTATPAGEKFVIDTDNHDAGWALPVDGVSSFAGEVDLPECSTPTPEPSPGPTPSGSPTLSIVVTPTPRTTATLAPTPRATVTPTHVRPGLPRTGA